MKKISIEQMENVSGGLSRDEEAVIISAICIVGPWVLGPWGVLLKAACIGVAAAKAYVVFG